MKKITLFLLLYFSQSAFSQDVVVDMTNYKSGVFAIQLVEDANISDTIVCKTCGGLKYSYPFPLNRIEIDFNFFIRKKRKNIQVPNIALTKNVHRQTIYYKNGFFMSYNGKSYLIFQIGTPNELKASVEIDHPHFVTILEDFEKCLQGD